MCSSFQNQLCVEARKNIIQLCKENDIELIEEPVHN